GQAHAPVAAADPDVHDVAPTALGVGLPHEFIQPPALGGDLFNGGGRAQAGVPGGAVLGDVGDAAVEQPLAHVRKAARVEQGVGRRAQFARADLAADVHLDSGGVDQP